MRRKVLPRCSDNMLPPPPIRDFPSIPHPLPGILFAARVRLYCDAMLALYHKPVVRHFDERHLEPIAASWAGGSEDEGARHLPVGAIPNKSSLPLHVAMRE